jgi:RNA polymerase sigma-70 factor (ECF subfamily)
MPATLTRTSTQELGASRAQLDDVAAEFALLRPRLLGIATRIVGSRTEAEDIVQDAWIRWQMCDRSRVRHSTAFLVTTTTRLAINAARSARARYESCTGQWSWEPVDLANDPTLAVERTEALARSLLLLVQRLTPTERMAYVLRHAFDYAYPRIAEVLKTSEANARQLVSRAGRHMGSDRHRFTARSEHDGSMPAADSVARAEEVAALERLFAAEAAGGFHRLPRRG